MRRCWPFFGAVLSALSACTEPGAPPGARSVVLVSIDTLRADHVGLYGYARDTTPFLDRLGAQGIVFESAYTSAAWTLVAHMSMLTGLYPEQHGVLSGPLALAEEAPLLAEHLARAGYQTVGLYRQGWIHERHGFARGFDVFRSHWTAEEAEEHLAEELARLDGARPCFLFLHLFDVHNDPSSKDPPSIFSSPPPYQDLFLPGARERLAGETYLSIKKRKLTADEREALAALYDDGIRHVDAVLERCFARLEAEGWLADALVIVTADHGESLAQRENYGHGGPWQEGLRVPLVLRLPGNERAGERVREVAHLVDVVPTVLAFAGLPHDPALAGRSLLEPLPAERVVTGGHGPVEFAVRGPEKLIRFGQKYGRVDLAADPHELDVQAATAEEYARLRAALALDRDSFHPPLTRGPMSPADREALDDLGYGGETEEE